MCSLLSTRGLAGGVDVVRESVSLARGRPERCTVTTLCWRPFDDAAGGAL